MNFGVFSFLFWNIFADWLVVGEKCSTFAAQKMVIGWLGATAMQGNPVRVRNCTCSCNPLKHRVCLLNVTGREDGWEGKADWGKVRRPAIV